MKWYLWSCSALVALSAFLWGYDVGSVNGVKEMQGYRLTFNISSSFSQSLQSDANETDEQCGSSDDVETSALLGIIVTVLSIGSFIGALLAGALSDFAGRKVAVTVGAGCCVVGGALQTGAFFVWMMILGRICYGVGTGIFFQVTPLYISEMAPKELRGRLVTMFQFASNSGILIGILVNVVMVNYIFGWRIALGIPVLVATTLVVLFTIFLPETPRWLIKRHKYTKALKVLKRIYEDEVKAEKEVEGIKASLDGCVKEKFGDTLKFLLNWNVLKRVLIGFFLLFIGRFGGSVLIWYYSVTLLCHIGIQGFLASIALGGAVWVTQFIGFVVVDKVGRKPLLLVSALCCVVCHLAIGTLIRVLDLEEGLEFGITREQRIAGYFVLVFMVAFVSVWSLSFGIVPVLVNSEIFPLQVRGITTALSSTGLWGGAIIISQLSPILIASPLGVYGTLYLMSGVCLLLFFYVLFLIPETKGRSLEEIDLLFNQSLLKRANLLCCLRFWKGGSHQLVPSGDREEEREELQLSFSSRSDSVESVDSDENEHKNETVL